MMPLTVPKDIDKYFYNRKSDIKKISRQINSIYEDLPCQLLITGKRGVGKTFLLKKILHDQKKDIITIYIDISQIYGKEGGNITEEAILKEILNQFKLKINEKNLLNKIKNLISDLKLKNYDITKDRTIFDIPIPKIKDNYSKLSEFVLDLPQKIVDSSENINGVIVVIDEFQQIKYVNNSEAFFWLFRSFIQDQKNVCYIFTGSVSKTADVIEMINGQTGAFGGRMIQFDIDSFSKEETLNYINDKASNIKFTNDGFDRFYKCTKGIPAYINTFCNILDSGITYDENKIKETFFMQMDQIVIMWLYVWGNLNSSEKSIIISLVENNSLSLKEIQSQSNLSKTTILKYLDSLSNKGIIKYLNKNYSLNDEMLKTWLKYKKETEGQYPQ